MRTRDPRSLPICVSRPATSNGGVGRRMSHVRRLGTDRGQRRVLGDNRTPRSRPGLRVAAWTSERADNASPSASERGRQRHPGAILSERSEQSNAVASNQTPDRAPPHGGGVSRHASPSASDDEGGGFQRDPRQDCASLPGRASEQNALRLRASEEQRSAIQRRAVASNQTECPRWDSNPCWSGFKPPASAIWATGARYAVAGVILAFFT